MIYTSFATENNDYKKVVEYYLIPSLEKFNLPYDIDYIKSMGTWNNNILYKPTFLKKMLLKHKQSIVSLDADAQIMKYPSLFSELDDYDIALHYLDNGLQWRGIPSPNCQKEALGGTLWINYNNKVMNFINKWIDIQKIEKGYPQKLMQKILEKNEFNLKIYKLPYSYVTIIKQDDTLPIHMIEKKDIVILHNQVSRRLKRR